MDGKSNMNGLTIQLPIVGTVVKRDAERRTFTVRTRGGTEFEAHIRPTTWFDTVTNLDRLGRQRLSLDRQEAVLAGAERKQPLEEHVVVGDLIAVEGVLLVNGGAHRYDALTVHLLKSHLGYYQFEHTFWWKGQIEAMGDKWLDNLFGDKRTYQLDDFSALYRTTLGIEGAPTTDDTQEMATLSRLIYGLASAYLLGGDERYFLAAKAGVEYQREAFRSYSADGRFCLWAHARRRDRHGRYAVLPSGNAEDAGTMPLYEQIYALAGLAQYHRITNDREVLEDIRRTLDMFDALFADRRDRSDQNPRGTLDGYFSHIDPVTFRWSDPELNRDGYFKKAEQKNWNSVGDHLPAYLINLILSLDPLPQVAPGPDGIALRDTLARLHDRAVEILNVTSRLIYEKFPEWPKGDAKAEAEAKAKGERLNPYVNERFTRDWKPIQDWGWQQNRAVVGHNLKIAWNLTRVANYYRAKGDATRANALFAFCRGIGRDMATLGIDQVRSGVYDAVERVPSTAGGDLPVQFGWLNTKDFWQQEQGILAYLILFGHHSYPADKASAVEAEDFLNLARELSAVWNLYFLDRDRTGIFFRVGDNGTAVVSGTYGDKGGHSISGYHAFELDFLAHVYQLAYLPREEQQHTTFCMHFRPSPTSQLRSINVLPDFLGPGAVELFEVEVDGVPRPVSDPQNFQVPLTADDLGRHVIARIRQSTAVHARLKQYAPPTRGWLSAEPQDTPVVR
jgi:hypothetical protein